MIKAVNRIIAHSGATIINIPGTPFGKFAHINRNNWSEGFKNEMFISLQMAVLL